jgi:hypothetical protein
MEEVRELIQIYDGHSCSARFIYSFLGHSPVYPITRAVTCKDDPIVRIYFTASSPSMCKSRLYTSLSLRITADQKVIFCERSCGLEQCNRPLFEAREGYGTSGEQRVADIMSVPQLRRYPGCSVGRTESVKGLHYACGSVTFSRA